jgi:glyoxylase-like metal-dependent hydrolase (beta-lactamase superfamily II)
MINLADFDKRLKDWYYVEGRNFSSNIYIRIKDNDILFIDTGGPGTNLLKYIESVSDKPRISIILTHGHWDHTGGLIELYNKGIEADIYVHRDDVEFYVSILRDKPFIDLSNMERIFIYGDEYKVIHTPGHTPGSICIIWDNNIFTGDTVFRDGWFGRTDFPGGSSDTLKRSISELRKINVENLFPGHMTPVIGDAKKHIQLAYDYIMAYL